MAFASSNRRKKKWPTPIPIKVGGEGSRGLRRNANSKFYCEIGSPGPQSYPTAPAPTVRGAWVELQRMVDQRGGGVQIVVEVTEHIDSPADGDGVVAGNQKRPASKIETLMAVRVGLASPATEMESHVANCCQGEGGTIPRVAFDRLTEKLQPLDISKVLRGMRLLQRAQIQIVGGEILSRPHRQPADFGGFQGGLDNASDLGCDLVLKLEHVFERTVEAVGLDMYIGDGVDQLRGDAHAIAGFAHRAFEDVADAELASHSLNIDRLVFVSDGRIAGDDEEPADAA